MDSWYVTKNDIEPWVRENKRDAEALLPLVIEKLIRASSVKLDSCEFPHGDAISRGGYDGVVVGVESHSEFLCSGDSVWEIGTDSTAQQKANSDYDKRSKTPDGVIQAETVYYQVSPRAWTKAKKWQVEKGEQGLWKEVRALNSITCIFRPIMNTHSGAS